MPENYDDLFDEQPENAAPGEPQLSKEDFAAKKQAERDSLSDLANQTEMEIAGDSGKFQQYLDTLSRFDRYSPQNTLLIFAQRPDAVKLGDFDRWKEAGISVSKGVTGIAIFEPGKEYRRDDGSTGVSMNIKKVFDISQTSARDKQQPEPQRDIRTLLKALMSSPPAPIKLVDTLSAGVGAHYNEQKGIIEVVHGMNGDSLFRCLAQEVSYVGMVKSDVDVADRGFTAYAASYVLCRKNGIDAQGYDFKDAPAYFEGMDGKDVRGEIRALRDTVNDISGRMTRVLEPPQKNAPSQEARG
ncbi:MAG: hypothetical protein FWF44_08275 [Defluviitaleaceae bacterium]|nr:hypothetical protein [Defluviitaleaceae bacterium]